MANETDRNDNNELEAEGPTTFEGGTATTEQAQAELQEAPESEKGPAYTDEA